MRQPLNSASYSRCRGPRSMDIATTRWDLGYHTLAQIPAEARVGARAGANSPGPQLDKTTA
jgi:hypothetical protein